MSSSKTSSWLWNSRATVLFQVCIVITCTLLQYQNNLRKLISTRPCAACLFSAFESQHRDRWLHSDEVQRTTAAQLCLCFHKAPSTQHAHTQLHCTGESSRTYTPVLSSLLFKQPAGTTLSSNHIKQATNVCSHVVKGLVLS